LECEDKLIYTSMGRSSESSSKPTALYIFDKAYASVFGITPRWIIQRIEAPTTYMPSAPYERQLVIS